MLRKFLGLLLTTSLVLSMSACGNTEVSKKHYTIPVGYTKPFMYQDGFANIVPEYKNVSIEEYGGIKKSLTDEIVKFGDAYNCGELVQSNVRNVESENIGNYYVAPNGEFNSNIGSILDSKTRVGILILDNEEKTNTPESDDAEIEVSFAIKVPLGADINNLKEKKDFFEKFYSMDIDLKEVAPSLDEFVKNRDSYTSNDIAGVTKLDGEKYWGVEAERIDNDMLVTFKVGYGYLIK